MTNLSVSRALSMACEHLDDSRVQYCDLHIAGDRPERVVLAGAVLDASTLQSVVSELQRLRPDLDWDTSSVTILRSSEPQRLTVATNMTGFFREPSWLAEQQSQVLNGAVLELLNEQDRWVFVRQEDGYLGWVYRPYLGPAEGAIKASHMVAAPVALLRKTPSASAPLVGRAFAGTAVQTEAPYDGWAEVKLAGGLCGYVPGDQLRPLAMSPQGEAARHQLITDAMQYIGVPYLWGGTTVQGIDCSGFAQLMHRLAGVTIPRDADQQFVAGEPVEPPFRAGDLLYFGGPGGHRAISHVGISLGPAHDPDGWQMIHSGRSRNGVYIDDVQAVESLRDSFRGARRFLAD